MKKIKLLVGVLLIVSAVAGLIFWEAKGRETVLCNPVLVAKSTIETGSPLTASLFTSAGIPEKNRMEGAFSPGEAGKVIGKVAAQTIVKNSQISAESVQEPDQVLKSGESVYVIPKKWIAMRSSGLRRGDWIKVYSRDGVEEGGRYRVAFVKDEAEREVKDAEEGRKTGLLDRLNSTSVINHLEIVTDLEGYQRLRQMAEKEVVSKEAPAAEEIEPALLIVYDPAIGESSAKSREKLPEAAGNHPETGVELQPSAGGNQEKGEEQHE